MWVVGLWTKTKLTARGALSTARAALYAIVMLMACASGTLAHEMSPAIADVTVNADAVVMEVSLPGEALLAGVDLETFEDTNDAPEASAYDDLRALSADAFEARFKSAWPLLSQGIKFTATGLRLLPELVSVDTQDDIDVALPRVTMVTLRADLPKGDDPVIFAWDAAFGPLILRHMVDDLPEDQEAYSAYLAAGQASAPLPRSGTATVKGLAAFVDYIVIGFEHILPKGLDHILFVLGLFFFSLKMRDLFWQVTTFTLAHSITLALATLGLVTVPGSIVEPLIAASIVFVAVENIVQTKLSRFRFAVIFAFGLLHGLGFASVLGDIGLAPGQFVASLIAFNIGVELGQITILLAAFALVGVWFGQKPWYRARIAVPASAAIAVIGGWWVIERVILT